MKVAVIGTGIAGLSAAYSLRQHVALTLFEANDYCGGHTHTVAIELPSPQPGGVPERCAVDTGFLVFNERTYPQFIGLMDELGVSSAPSDMSFAVHVKAAFGLGRDLIWSGSDLNSVFAQRRNLLRPRFWRLLREIIRFNRLASALAIDLAHPLDIVTGQAAPPAGLDPSISLAEFLAQNRFSDEFQHWYLLPMLGCIWSCPTDQMLRFPLVTLLRFCANHGLIQIQNRPQWHTIKGGARHYVDKILAQLPPVQLNCAIQSIERDPHVQAGGVVLNWRDARGTQQRAQFDKVIVATHSDQALALLAQPSSLEQACLGQIRYQSNRAVLHTDAAVMPPLRRAWAAWNYQQQAAGQAVCLHYWINRLQPLPITQDVFVSLNPIQEIDPGRQIAQYDYAHPIFDVAALQAQGQIAQLQGQAHSYFCGAWVGYGFHEDGLKSGRAAAQQLLQAIGVAAVAPTV